jgi:hypothetical protein
MPKSRNKIVSILTKIRLGEYFTLTWIFFGAMVVLFFGRSSGVSILNQNIAYSPLILLLLITLCCYLVPLILVSAKKLSLILPLIKAREKSAAAALLIDFDSELETLRACVRLFRDITPVYLILVFYPTTDFLISCLQGQKIDDDLLIKLDLLIFRSHLSVWMERFISPQLTDFLSLCYSLHLMFPSVILLFICLFCPRSLFIEATQGLIIISIIGFALYILVPAVGPKYALANLYTKSLGGGMLGQMNNALIDLARVRRDAFPSLHVGISALLLTYAWRANKWLWLLVLPFTLGNWISTIYLRYHYTIDVVVAFPLVWFVHYIVHWWTVKFSPQQTAAQIDTATDAV